MEALVIANILKSMRIIKSTNSRLDEPISYESAYSVEDMQSALKFQQIVGQLDEKLERRPSREELVTNNILRERANSNKMGYFKMTYPDLTNIGGNFSFLITSNTLPDLSIDIDLDINEMETDDFFYPVESESFESIVEHLDRKMYTRPDIDLLINNGILKDEPGRIAASLQATQTNLNKALQLKTLEHKLEQRPSIDQLHDQHILHNSIESTISALKRHQIANTIEETIRQKSLERSSL